MSINTKENLLSKISRAVGLDLAKHFENGKWIILKFSVVAIGGWLLSLAFARLGTKETLGQYQYILSFITVVSLSSLPGLNTAALEAVANGREGGVLRATRLSFLFSLLGLVILLGIGLYHFFCLDKHLVGKILIFAGFLAPFYYAFNTWNIYYDGKSLFRASSLRTIALYILLYCFLISGLFLGANALWLTLIYLCVHIAVFLYYFIEMRKKITDHSNNAIDIKFAVNSSIQRFVFSLSSHLPPLAISALFGLEAIALYFIGFYMINASASLMGMLAYLYIPALFRGEKINYIKVLLQNVAIGILFWIGFVVFVKYLFIFMYGIEYSESQKLAFIFSFLIILVPIKIFLMNYFLTGKKNWTIITIVSIANVLSLGLLYLVKGYGFTTSIAIYVYTLELITLIPLLIVYIRDNSINSLIKSSVKGSI